MDLYKNIYISLEEIKIFISSILSVQKIYFSHLYLLMH